MRLQIQDFLKFVFLIFMLIGYSGCDQASNPSQAQIAGGAVFDLAVHYQHPAAFNTVALIDENTGLALCSGSLIGSQHVLTAKHCVQPLQKTTFALYFGHDALSDLTDFSKTKSHPLVRKIESIAPYYPNLAKAFLPNFDLAVLHFKGDIPPESGYRPLPLLHDIKTFQTWTQIQLYETWIVGFGKIHSKAKSESKGLKRLLQVTIDGIYDSGRFVSLLVIKAPALMGACHGDSGGPIYIKDSSTGAWFIAGITQGINEVLTPEASDSNTLDPCESSHAVYTFPGNFSAWIDQVMQQDTLGKDGLLADMTNPIRAGYSPGPAIQNPWSFAQHCQLRDPYHPDWMSIEVILKQLRLPNSKAWNLNLYTDCKFAAKKVADFSVDKAKQDLELILSHQNYHSLNGDLAALLYKGKHYSADLRLIGSMKKLKGLRISQINIHHPEALQSLSSLEKLEINKVSNLDVLNLDAALPNLAVLQLESLTQLKTLSLKAASGQPRKLKKLLLSNLPMLESNIFSNIQSLPELELKNFPLSVHDINSIVNLSDLESLKLTNSAPEPLEMLCILEQSKTLKKISFDDNLYKQTASLSCLNNFKKTLNQTKK